jgi:hypothetical protein
MGVCLSIFWPVRFVSADLITRTPGRGQAVGSELGLSDGLAVAAVDWTSVDRRDMFAWINVLLHDVSVGQDESTRPVVRRDGWFTPDGRSETGGLLNRLAVETNDLTLTLSAPVSNSISSIDYDRTGAIDKPPIPSQVVWQGVEVDHWRQWNEHVPPASGMQATSQHRRGLPGGGSQQAGRVKRIVDDRYYLDWPWVQRKGINMIYWVVGPPASIICISALMGALGPLRKKT